MSQGDPMNLYWFGHITGDVKSICLPCDDSVLSYVEGMVKAKFLTQDSQIHEWDSSIEKWYRGELMNKTSVWWYTAKEKEVPPEYLMYRLLTGE